MERTLYVRVATLKFIRLWIESHWTLDRSETDFILDMLGNYNRTVSLET